MSKATYKSTTCINCDLKKSVLLSIKWPLFVAIADLKFDLSFGDTKHLMLILVEVMTDQDHSAVHLPSFVGWL